MIRILQSVLPAFLAGGVAGPALARSLPAATALVLVVTGSVAMAALARRLEAGEPRLALVAAAALLGCLHTLAPPTAPVPVIDEPLCLVRGRIVSRHDGRFGPELRLERAEASALLAPAGAHAIGPVRVRVRGPLPAALDRGVAVRARGRLRSRLPDRLELITPSAVMVEPECDPLTRAAFRVHDLRGAIARRLEETLLSRPAASMAAALLTGRRLDREISPALRDAGVVHLFVVSGLHLALVALMLSRFPPFAGARTGFRPLLLALAVTAFALFTGARPPVLRALAAAWIVALARRHGRSVDGGWVVLVVGALHLALAPDLARDPSFLLSMSAVCGITFLARPWRDERPDDALDDFLRRKDPRPLRRAARSALVVSAAATAATAPVSLAVFGRATPASVVMTPLLAPLVGLFGLASTAALVSPRFAWAANALAALLLRVCSEVASVVGTRPLDIPPSAIMAHALVLMAGAVTANARSLSRPRRRIVSIVVLGSGLPSSLVAT